MSRVAIRHREKLDGVSEIYELGRSATEVDFAIVGMRADAKYSQHVVMVR